MGEPDRAAWPAKRLDLDTAAGGREMAVDCRRASHLSMYSDSIME